MLKGETTIELTDVHTGEKEEIKSENMFTNALQNIIDVYSKLNTSNIFENTNMFPLINNLLGGIMLFDSMLEEDINNISPPTSDDAICTAYANVYANPTNDTKRGAINKLESGAIDGGYKFVWDFATSQGNGEIASAALTTKTGGVCGATPNRYAGLVLSSESDTSSMDVWDRQTTTKLFGTSNSWKVGPILNVEGSDTSINIDNIYPCHMLFFDVDNLCFSMAKCEAVDGKLKLFLFDLYPNLANLKLNRKPLLLQEIRNCRSCEICSDNGVFGNINKLPIVALPYDENFCYLVKAVTKSALAIAKINRSTMQIEFCKKGDVSPFLLSLNIFQPESNDPFAAVSAVSNGYLYLMDYEKSNPNNVLKINTDNMSEIKELICARNEKYGYYGIYAFGRGGRAICQGKRIILPYGIIENEQISLSTFSGIANSEMFFAGSIIKGAVVCMICKETYDTHVVLGVVSNAMMTINNLPSPVVKTADKTMKITYIVRDVDETV